MHKLLSGGQRPGGSRPDRRRKHRPIELKLPLLYQPGTVWDYGFGLDVLGLIIEQLTEQSLGDYLGQQNIWKPFPHG